MKQLLFSLFLLILPFMAQAQVRYGYLSCDSVLRLMPEYAAAQQSMAQLRQKYEAETKRSEEEFNVKYEEFLEGQRDYVPSILQKRQAELQDMMNKNTAFRQEARRLLAQAERDAYAPVRKRLAALIAQVARERGLSFVLNTDADAVPYIDPSMAEYIGHYVAAMAGAN